MTIDHFIFLKFSRIRFHKCFEICQTIFKFLRSINYRKNRCNRFTLVQWQQVHHWATFRTTRCLRHFIHFQAIHFTDISKAKHCRMVRCHNQMLNVIIFFHRSCRLTTTTTTLCSVVRQWLSFRITSF